MGRTAACTLLLAAAALAWPVGTAAQPQISIADFKVEEGDPVGTTWAIFVVTLDAPSAAPVSVSWATANGTAVDPTDYIADSGSVLFNPSEVTKLVNVEVVRNLVAQSDRTFYVDLSAPSGGTLLKQRGVTTIFDDDAANPPVVGLVVLSDGGALAGTGRNRLQWRNPVFSGSPKLRVRWNERGAPCTLGDYPTDPTGPSDGVVSPDPDLVGTHESQVYEHTGLTLDVDYCYTAWVADPGPPYSAGAEAGGRPFDATQSIAWKYFTGATALAAPTVGLDGVVGVSNDLAVHVMQRGAGGGPWPLQVSPVVLGAPAQHRSPVVTSGGVSRAFITTQDGVVQAVNVKNGAVIWKTPLTPAAGQGAPAGVFVAWGSPWDYILVGTRDDSLNNRFYALDASNGAIVDYYPKPVDGVVGLGPISGMASVDYTTRRVYFGLTDPTSGSTTYTLLCLDLGSAADALQLGWGLMKGDIDEINTSPVLRDGRVYVGAVDDKVWSIPALDGSMVGSYNKGVGDGGVKGFVFPDRRNGDLYMATNNKVQVLVDTGAALVDGFSDVSVKEASEVVLWTSADRLYVGSTDVGGNRAGIYEIDVTDPDPNATKKWVVLEDSEIAVGSPSLDIVENMIHVGSESGVFFAIPLPLP